MYANGLGTPQDYSEATKWFRKAADQGDAMAQTYLGRNYENGRGVKQDYTEAVNWYRKAANQGDATAQNNLGSMYASGRGLPRDYVGAYMWFSLSAAQGDKIARKYRDLIAPKMTPMQIAEAQKLAGEWKPTMQPPR